MHLIPPSARIYPETKVSCRIKRITGCKKQTCSMVSSSKYEMQSHSTLPWSVRMRMAR